MVDCQRQQEEEEEREQLCRWRGWGMMEKNWLIREGMKAFLRRS